MVYKVSKYESDGYNPVRTADPNKKDEDYFRKNSEAIYSAYLKGRTGVTFMDAYDYSTLRLFADGRQSEDRYKNYFSREELPSPADVVNIAGTQTGNSRESKRKGYFNVLWDVVSPATKHISTLVGMFLSYEYDVAADPVDPYSKNFVEDEKIRLWVEKENMGYFKGLLEQVGLEYKQPEFVPETVEELDLYEMSGGFKPSYAKVMEKLIKHTLDISSWRDEIKKKLYKDLINLSVACTRDYYCPVDQKVKTRYVDPEYLVVQYSRHPDFHDIEFGGEFYDVTVTELLMAGFDRAQVEGIAKDYSGYNGNPTADRWGEYSTEIEAGVCGYDFFKICVFDCEWIDSDAKKELIHKNRYGKESVSGYDYKKKLTPNQRLRETIRKFRYHCKWVVGTGLIYEFGKDTDQTRDGKKVSLTFHPYKLETRSITRQLIPLYDNFQILWVKYQNALSMAVNSGYAINVDLLSNMKSDKGKDAKEEGVKRFLESGFLFYKETNPQGLKNTNLKPIEQLEGGIGQMFTDIIAGFNFNTMMIENITGLNPISMGATPDPNAPVGTTEMSVNSMTSTLKPILSGYLRVKQNMAQNITRWIQILVKYNKKAKDAYISTFGQFDIEVLVQAEGDNVRYGVNLEPRPTAIEKKALYDSANISLSNGRDGKPGINEADFFAIVRILENGGSLLFAETILQNRIRKARLEFQKSQMDNQTSNNEAMQAGEKMKTEREVGLKLLEHKNKMAELEVEHTYRMEEIKASEGIRTMKEIQVTKMKNEAQKESEKQPETAT
jgi:hypothetical protein